MTDETYWETSDGNRTYGKTLATPVWKLDFMARTPFELKNSSFSFKSQFGLKKQPSLVSHSEKTQT
jgi:hypothetical protein